MNARASEVVLKGELRYDEPMASHTSWRLGGNARMFFKPADLEDLRSFLAGLDHDVPVLFVGLGSNLLVRDGGWPGAVISTLGLAKGIEDLGDGRLRVGAGVPCTRLARHCVRNGLGPAAFLAGIPGSVGGALTMNAGAFGGETWEFVESVETIDRGGHIRRRLKDEYQVGYRAVTAPADEWFLSADFIFASDPDASMADIQRLVDERKATQPIGQPSCGSVFRNPPGGFAAQLIETAGLKGEVRGDAQVSEKHANFIINRGQATASDVETLIEHIRGHVKKKHDVELTCEVRIVGDKG